MAGSDYFSDLSSIIFDSESPDNTTRCVNIIILDDDALEGNQTFALTLTTADPDVILGTTETDITITDDDS